MSSLDPQMDWQNNLPRIDDRFHDEKKLLARARYKSADGTATFWALQGQPQKHPKTGYLYWGYAKLPDRRFPIAVTVSAENLDSGNWQGNVICKIDETFVRELWEIVKKENFQ